MEEERFVADACHLVKAPHGITGIGRPALYCMYCVTTYLTTICESSAAVVVEGDTRL